MQNEIVCKGQYVGINHFVRCLEEKPSKCPFAVPLGGAYFCQSPILSYNENGSQKLTHDDLSKDHEKRDNLISSKTSL